MLFKHTLHLISGAIIPSYLFIKNSIAAHLNMDLVYSIQICLLILYL